MNNFNPFNTDNKIELHAEQQQKKESQFLGSERKIKGLTLWELNTETMEIKPAEFVNTSATLGSLNAEDLEVRHKVNVKYGCNYLQALNEKNARKHFRKFGFDIP
jgi:hypothetical protein